MDKRSRALRGRAGELSLAADPFRQPRASTLTAIAISARHAVIVGTVNAVLTTFLEEAALP